MTSPMFAREDRDEIAVVRMSHGKVSALDTPFCDALTGELDRIERGPARAVVLTGTGSTFSAGVDLFQLLDGGPEYVQKFLPSLNRVLRTLLLFPKPLVAAVNGHAIAGGCIIVAAADHRVMARGSGRVGVPELAVGVPFPRLPLEMVASRVSPVALRTLIFTARTVPPDEALAVGFVDEVVDAEQLLDRAVAVARHLASIPSQTFTMTKRALTAPVIERVDASRDETDMIEAWHSPDVYAAIRRYLEKTIRRA